MSDADLELAQLLCTRLCHDLAGPVGAVAAGVELIGGDPAQADTETLGLIGGSSAAASLKLKFMRTALGGAGGATQDPRALIEGYLEAIAGPSGKAALTWPQAAAAAGHAGLAGNWTQMALNLCLLALETQPACKALGLDVSNAKGSAGEEVVIRIESRCAPERSAALRAELVSAVACEAGAVLGPKNIHGNLTGRLVRAAGGRIDLKAEGNVITVTAVFPKAAS